ncbi:MAG: ankyrin repeat domain-containing protein [Geminicoccaceae bacterium]
MRQVFILLLAMASFNVAILPAAAQRPPSPSDVEGYDGLHQAAHVGDVAAIRALVAEGSDLEARDRAGRTPLHVAAFASKDDAVRVLVEMGADLNALENQAYDIVTIAAVANDLDMVDLALKLGTDPGNITSPYDGTALIAAAHLGHHEVVRRLIEGGAPLDHVNNLHWTALMEAVVLGDGGPDHVAIVRALMDAGADQTLADREGVTPIEHARMRGYDDMIEILENAD